MLYVKSQSSIYPEFFFSLKLQALVLSVNVPVENQWWGCKMGGKSGSKDNLRHVRKICDIVCHIQTHD